MSYYVYILECADKTLYTGITTNIEKRIVAHNTLKTGAAYTKARRPVRLLYSELCTNRSEATKRECAIKRLPRKEKLDFVRKDTGSDVCN